MGGPVLRLNFSNHTEPQTHTLIHKHTHMQRRTADWTRTRRVDQDQQIIVELIIVLIVLIIEIIVCVLSQKQAELLMNHQHSCFMSQHRTHEHKPVQVPDLTNTVDSH